MKISSKQNQGVILLSFEGEMTVYNATEIKLQLLPFFTRDSDLEIDLSQVSDMDSAGTQLLILTKLELAKANKSLALSAHSRAVLDTFELYNLAGFFGDPLLISSAATGDALANGSAV